MNNQKRSEFTQTRIMQAAVHLFAQQGYNAAGVAEICEAAQVSKGAFYHHFKSKNALFVFLLEKWLSDLDRRLSHIAAQSTPFPAQLVMMAQMMSDIFDTYQDQIPILFEFWMQASRDDEVWSASIAPFQRYQDYFAGLIQKGIEEGHLRDMDPQVGAQTIISLAIGSLLQGMLTQHIPQGQVVSENTGVIAQSMMGDWGKSACVSIDILLNGLKR